MERSEHKLFGRTYPAFGGVKFADADRHINDGRYNLRRTFMLRKLSAHLNRRRNE